MNVSIASKKYAAFMEFDPKKAKARRHKLK